MASRIGFIGVGAMGAPMVERLLAAGREVAVFDVNAAAMQPLVACGAVAAGSARAAAVGAETVFACLPAPEISKSVALGPDGVAGVEGLRTYIRNLHDRHCRRQGDRRRTRRAGRHGARRAGQRRAARCTRGQAVHHGRGRPRGVRARRPMFDAIAGKVFYVGAEPGLGPGDKLANNMMSAAGMAGGH